MMYPVVFLIMSQIDLQHVDDQMLHAQTDECTSSSVHMPCV